MLLENDKIRLRAPEPEDLEVFYKWENDSSLWRLGSCMLTPCSRYDLKRYLASPNDLYESKQVRFTIEHKSEKKAIGTIDLYDFEPYHRRAAVGILIDEAYRGNGWGTDALSLLYKYAFSFLKLHQLYACVLAGNEPSKKLFAGCGFKETGLLYDWLQTENGYEDVQMFSLISGL